MAVVVKPLTLATQGALVITTLSRSAFGALVITLLSCAAGDTAFRARFANVGNQKSKLRIFVSHSQSNNVATASPHEFRSPFGRLRSVNRLRMTIHNSDLE
jgi:hypothetical protein